LPVLPPLPGADSRVEPAGREWRLPWPGRGGNDS
jgi:hypothetical protein